MLPYFNRIQGNKKGSYVHRKSDYTIGVRYSPEIAQQKYEAGLQNRGAGLKIGSDFELANYIEDKIVNGIYSTDAVIGELSLPENEGKLKPPSVRKWFTTILIKGFSCA